MQVPWYFTGPSLGCNNTWARDACHRLTPCVPGACAQSTDAFPVVGVRDMKQATEQKQMPA